MANTTRGSASNKNHQFFRLSHDNDINEALRSLICFRAGQLIKQLLNSVFVRFKIIKVSVSVISLAFGSADNAYLDLDNYAYHKNLIQ
jgi:hypothetical protein